MSVFDFSRFYRSGRLSQSLLWLACGAGVAGLLAARALIALSPVVGVLAALANPGLPRAWPNYFRNGAALRAALLYVFVLLSGFYTSDWPTWRHELFRLLPWLGVPLAFAVAVPLSGAQRRAVGSSYVFGAAAVGLATVAAFYLGYTAQTVDFNLNQNVSSVTRVFHIHFGVMLALAAFWGWNLGRHAATPAWRYGHWAAAAACVLTLHLLAYRTGLLALYATLLAEALYLLLAQRRPKLSLLVLLVLGAGLATALSLAPVQRRLSATRWDVEQYLNGADINNLSVARRLAAWQTARTVVAEHPWLGVGPADAYQAMMDQYSWRDYGLTPQNRVMIHNQYLHYLVGGGALGLALWLAALLWPLAQPAQRRNPYLRQFVLVLGTAMLVDSLLELQTSYNLFVFGYGFLVVAGERHARPTRPAA